MILAGNPLKGKELENLKKFLNRMELDYDDGIEYTVCLLNEEYEIIGTGSVEENVLKCIAIDSDYQGQGMAATIITQLIQYEFEQGRAHLFMYTKPKNRELFEDLSFYKILETPQVLFMENQRSGFADYMKQLRKETVDAAMEPNKKIGAIVANCNPFTFGHRYLMETASKECDFVHVFVLSDKRTQISAEDRFELVKQGTADLTNLILHRTSEYMVSAATFPTYFMKEKHQAEKANCRLDLELFGSKIAPQLNISRRYVGTEPGCKVTNVYNQTMMQVLPEYGMKVIEIERLKHENLFISASVVRERMQENRIEELNGLVPETTLRYLKQCIK